MVAVAMPVLVKNGSFENVVNGSPEPWLLFIGETATIEVDNTIFSSGSRSLKFSPNTDGCGAMAVHQELDPGILEAGVRYRIQFEYRSDFTASGLTGFGLILQGNYGYNLVPKLQFEKDTWKDFQVEFMLPDDLKPENISLQLIFCVLPLKELMD